MSIKLMDVVIRHILPKQKKRCGIVFHWPLSQSHSISSPRLSTNQIRGLARGHHGGHEARDQKLHHFERLCAISFWVFLWVNISLMLCGVRANRLGNFWCLLFWNFHDITRKSLVGVIMREGKCVRVVAKVLITIDMCNYFRVD